MQKKQEDSGILRKWQHVYAIVIGFLIGCIGLIHLFCEFYQ